MPYDEDLAERVREIVNEKAKPTEMNMFGGIAFMVSGHMCVGVIKGNVVLRLGGEEAELALQNPDVRPMDFTGKPMRNFLYLEPGTTSSDSDLRAWIDKALEFVATLPPKRTKTRTR